MSPRYPRVFRLVAASSLAVATLVAPACSDAVSPIDDEPGDDPATQDPPKDTTNTSTRTIPPTGGTVALADGTVLTFPAGVITSAMDVTLTKADPATWFDGGDNTQRVVIAVDAPVTQFSKEVEIRVPLPASATLADSSNVLVGLIDDDNGALTVERSAIRIIDGKPYLVLATTHFSERLFEWFIGKTPPAKAGPLMVPYYNQGASPYCWATSLHMVTQAVKFDELRTIPEIIGGMGVDEGGITSFQFRFGSGISNIVQSRTGVRPTRQTWDYVNVNQMKDYLRREIGNNGRPVALFNGVWSHAVVVVGYDGSTFVIHDPASTTNGSIGYTRKTWTEIAGSMGVTENMVTLAIPAALATPGAPIRVNYLPQALQFTKPFQGTDSPSGIWRYAWDYTQKDGYVLQHASRPEFANRTTPLPAGVSRITAPGDIQISNASLTDAHDVSVWLDVKALGAPADQGKYSVQQEVSVPANTAVSFKPALIPVDTFRYNTAAPTEYSFTVTAMVGGTTVDRQSLHFSIASAKPELTSLDPSTAGIGQTVKIRGKEFGTTKFNNTIAFNGTKVTKVLSWTDSVITVVVPDGATSGNVVLTRGQVASNGVPFTVQDVFTSQSFDLTWGVRSNSIEVQATVTVTATSAGAGWKKVRTESSTEPGVWVRHYFKSVPPAAGGSNQYEISVKVNSTASDLWKGKIELTETRWKVWAQSGDYVPPTEVKGDPLVLTELDSWASKMADLYLAFTVTKDSGDVTNVELGGYTVSFSPTHN
jgi:hypothetical protein